jgi:hypothetical protein
MFRAKSANSSEPVAPDAASWGAEPDCVHWMGEIAGADQEPEPTASVHGGGSDGR